MTRPWGAALAILLLAGCSRPERPPDPPSPAVSRWEALAVAATPLRASLPPESAATLAGAWTLSASPGARLHGLSDIKYDPAGRLVLVSDNGDLFELPVEVRAGALPARVRRLPGRKGDPLRGKEVADAEGLAVMPDGQLLVSFERRHRISLYTAAGDRPESVAAPTVRMKDNDGLEALSLAADGSYWAAEQKGRVWACALGERCRRMKARVGGKGEALPGMDLDPRGRGLFVLTRRFRPGGFSSTVSLLNPSSLNEDRARLRPLVRLDGKAGLPDNFEGVGAQPLPDGRVRLWLVADDGFESRTVLLALDLR